jgi:hypothetical protein
MSYQVWFQNNTEKINNLLDGVSDLGADESKTHNYYDDLKGDLELFADLEAHILSAKDTDFEVIFKSISSIFDIIKNRNLQGFDRIKESLERIIQDLLNRNSIELLNQLSTIIHENIELVDAELLQIFLDKESKMKEIRVEKSFNRHQYNLREYQSAIVGTTQMTEKRHHALCLNHAAFEEASREVFGSQFQKISQTEAHGHQISKKKAHEEKDPLEGYFKNKLFKIIY